ncbi:hypothetical protein V6N11_013655 [Hibiscus sabdariffa]|uniref:Uncharacterized protein n=2 Tax=Hibiscus sabdariffa TaxID=183260 RepID=A0ABR2AWG6_9ROSI
MPPFPRSASSSGPEKRAHIVPESSLKIPPQPTFGPTKVAPILNFKHLANGGHQQYFAKGEPATKIAVGSCRQSFNWKFQLSLTAFNQKRERNLERKMSSLAEIDFPLNSLSHLANQILHKAAPIVTSHTF